MKLKRSFSCDLTTMHKCMTLCRLAWCNCRMGVHGCTLVFGVGMARRRAGFDSFFVLLGTAHLANGRRSTTLKAVLASFFPQHPVCVYVDMRVRARVSACVCVRT
jgi:hypothetical protein